MMITTESDIVVQKPKWKGDFCHNCWRPNSAVVEIADTGGDNSHIMLCTSCAIGVASKLLKEVTNESEED
jgi:RNase P subunit RPR2